MALPRYFTITARFTKRFVKGDKTGVSEHESLSFVTLKDAERWVNTMQNITTLHYVIENVSYEVIK